MPKTYKAPFIQKSFQVGCVVTNASAGYTTPAPTNLVLLATGGENDSVLFDIYAMVRATPTSSRLMLFVSDDNGNSYYPRDSAQLPTTAISTTTDTPAVQFTKWTKDNPMFLKQGQKLYAATQVAIASGIAFAGTQGDY